MSDIQRISDTTIAGGFLARMTRGDTKEVYYYSEADHVAALAQADADWRVKWMRDTEVCRKAGIEQGQRDALAAQTSLSGNAAVRTSEPEPPASVAPAGEEHGAPANHHPHTFYRGYEQGQRDALAAAVQRVEALDAGWHDSNGESVLWRNEVIAAIKGDSDE